MEKIKHKASTNIWKQMSYRSGEALIRPEVVAHFPAILISKVVELFHKAFLR